MNAILGLMRKDWSLMKKQIRMVAVYLVILFVIFSFTTDGMVAFVPLFSILMFLMSTNCFAYDEQVNFGKLLAASPLPASRVVLSRYLLSLLVGTLGGAILTLLQLVLSSFREPEEASPEVPLSAFLISAGIALLLVSILFPLFYKFGVNKSRLMILLVCAVPAAAAALLQFVIPETVWRNLAVPPALLTALPWLAGVLLVLALLVSMRISVGILRRQEH